MSESKGVDAVERALRLLDCFSVEQDSCSLAELAQLTGLYKSTILRLIVSLERFDYLYRGADGRYRLEASTWRLGTVFRQGFLLADTLRPELSYLSEQIRETASFYVRSGSDRVCLYRSEPNRSIRHSIAEGSTLPLNVGASGHVLMAFGDKDSDEEQVRSKGHSITLGERDPEVAAVSVPIWLPNGEFAGALAVSGLIHRFGATQQQILVDNLLESQKRLHERTAPPTLSEPNA